jgi:hypothetical protein
MPVRARTRSRQSSRFGQSSNGAAPIGAAAFPSLTDSYVYAWELEVGSGKTYATVEAAVAVANTLQTSFYLRGCIRVYDGTYAPEAFWLQTDFVDFIGESKAGTILDINIASTDDTLTLDAAFEGFMVVPFNTRFENFTIDPVANNTFGDYNAIAFFAGTPEFVTGNPQAPAMEPPPSHAVIKNVDVPDGRIKRVFLVLSEWPSGLGAVIYNSHIFEFDRVTVVSSSHGFASFGGCSPQVKILDSDIQCGKYNFDNSILGLSEYWTFLLNPSVGTMKNKYGATVKNSVIKQWNHNSFFTQCINVEYSPSSGGYADYIDSEFTSTCNDPVNQASPITYMPRQSSLYLEDLGYPDATWSIRLRNTTMTTNSTGYAGNLRWGGHSFPSPPYTGYDPDIDYDGVGTAPAILYYPADF